MNRTERRRHRALFLSDFHLGARGARAGELLDFLTANDADTIYLLGDIIDGWRLCSRWYWPPAHSAVLRELRAKAKEGTRVLYLPGNHDEFARRHFGRRRDGIEILDSAIHRGADGKRYLVLHGDRFDPVIRHMPWLAAIGDRAYGVLLVLNTFVNGAGRHLRLPYWSFSLWAKRRVKTVVNLVGSFEEAITRAAAEHHVDGIVCGHIHWPVIHDRFGLTYVNCGDWVESCTAISEDGDGRLAIIEWGRTDLRAGSRASPVGAVNPARAYAGRPPVSAIPATPPRS